MRYCSACGAPVHEDARVCGRCGAALPREKTRRPGSDRGLKLAIAAVASLWVITAVLWMLWPRLSQAVPTSQTQTQGALSVGLNQEPDASPEPTATPAPTPTPTAAPLPTTQAPAPTPVSPASPSPNAAGTVERLEHFTWWWGYLFVNNCTGDNPLGKDVIQVWGYIGFTNDNRNFFEIYDTREVLDDTVPLVSYYAELHTDSLVPIIGDRDAWVLDRYLDPSDTEPLTLYLVDGSLKLNYRYETEGTSCDLFCMLVPED